MNHKYSLVLITPRIFNSKILYFGWWERSWLNLYDHIETRLIEWQNLDYTTSFGDRFILHFSKLFDKISYLKSRMFVSRNVIWPSHEPWLPVFFIRDWARIYLRPVEHAGILVRLVHWTNGENCHMWELGFKSHIFQRS
jgi:hypothetical protein